MLFCYEAYDELVLMQLQEFDKKKLTSVEKEMRQEPEEHKEVGVCSCVCVCDCGCVCDFGVVCGFVYLCLCVPIWNFVCVYV